MAKIECKMCGGKLDLPDDVTIGTCPYCGTTTTFPKITSDHVEQLYSRAEHYRHAGDFDKAISAYEAIVREAPDDAEAYWGLVLSRFGIEYVEDPISHERIPTCHRVQYESILSDSDYQLALENATDEGTREVYENEATRIGKIQKDILAISSKEEPFDVFICYKETTDGGSRTKDSLDAQEIYYQLTNAGYKVFFSRITLEDKLGQQYEPYIFAALNSAKVMLVIGSRKEYFNAVWVKNEWSRFLSLMKKNRSKLLIPCYKDMDVYDLPEELSMLQSQDMSKIGFIQDLLRGIEKIIKQESNKETKIRDNKKSSKTKTTKVADVVEPLLKRAHIFKENYNYAQKDKYIQKAIQACEKILDNNPECAEAYLYKLVAEKSMLNVEELLCYFDIDELKKEEAFKLFKKFANKELLEEFSNIVKNREKEIRYRVWAVSFKENFNSCYARETIQDYIDNLKPISGYKDVDELIHNGKMRITQMHDIAIKDFQELCQRFSEDGNYTYEEWVNFSKQFQELSREIPEAKEKFKQCQENIEQLECEKKKKQQEIEKRQEIEEKKSIAYDYYLGRKYEAALKLYMQIKDYSDVTDKINDCQKYLKEQQRENTINTIFCVLIIFGGFIFVMFLLLFLPHI